MKVSIIKLGCPKNDVDAEVMHYLLEKAGHEMTTDNALADAIIVNTCGFIGDAKKESVNRILDMSEYKKSGSCKALVVTGCLSQRYREELFAALPEVDLMLGVNEYPQIVPLLEKQLSGQRVLKYDGSVQDPFIPGRVLLPGSGYAYLKIAEGCDNRCAYCAIPDIRGPYRSRPEGDVLGEARWLAEQGVSELVLIAQDTTRYGSDRAGSKGVTGLLKGLTKVDGMQRIRLLYCYPELLTDELLDLVSGEKKICSYIDMPLQHIDDRILRLMNRRSTELQIRALVKRIRTQYDITLRTTFIVGFPTETDDEFAKLLDFVQESRFDNMGAFVFSPEEGTPAYMLKPRVPAKIAKQRHHALMTAQQQISASLLAGKVGREFDVLVDGIDDNGEYCGRTGGQAPEIDGVVFLDGQHPDLVGKMARVLITNAYEYDLRGIVL